MKIKEKEKLAKFAEALDRLSKAKAINRKLLGIIAEEIRGLVLEF